MIESRQSYSKESRVQFFWPTLYVVRILWMLHAQLGTDWTWTVSVRLL